MWICLCAFVSVFINAPVYPFFIITLLLLVCLGPPLDTRNQRFYGAAMGWEATLPTRSGCPASFDPAAAPKPMPIRWSPWPSLAAPCLWWVTGQKTRHFQTPETSCRSDLSYRGRLHADKILCGSSFRNLSACVTAQWQKKSSIYSKPFHIFKSLASFLFKDFSLTGFSLGYQLQLHWLSLN